MRVSTATRLGAVICSAAIAQSVYGFSKHEHEQIAFYAFAAAGRELCGNDLASAAPAFVAVREELCGCWNEPAEITDSSSTRQDPCRHSLSREEFALVTRAVDQFTHPARLAPTAQQCQTGAKDECRKTVRKDCRRLRLDDEACLRLARQETLKRTKKRAGNPVLRFLAVHRNNEHFRRSACESFNELHDRALDFVENGKIEMALLAEAVAVHFLQDALAPGHLAAPRDQFADWQAGAVHDRTNRNGLPVSLGDDLCQEIEAFSVPSSLPEPSWLNKRKKKNRIHWADLSADLESLQEVCKKGSDGYIAYGDKSLLSGVGQPDARAHAATVFFLTYTSLRDLYSPRPDLESLRLYYQEPLIELPSDNRIAPSLGVGRIVAKNEVTQDGEDGRADVSDCPAPPDRGLLFSYRTTSAAGPSARGNASTQIQAGALSTLHLLNTLQIGYSSWGDARQRWELDWDVSARERMKTRTENGVIIRGKLWRRYLGVGSVAFHHEELGGNDAWGAGLLFTGSKLILKHHDLDFYVGIEPGLGRYTIDGASTTRVRGSVRAGVGLSVVAVEVLGERGLSLDTDQAGEKEWRFSLNLRVRLSPTWRPWADAVRR
ncbi:MAG: hypothetical protein IH936_08755 [Acidobacteria bacterium]|nr:hypothetical protein [Acidobacteriota bacterium]